MNLYLNKTVIKSKTLSKKIAKMLVSGMNSI